MTKAQRIIVLVAAVLIIATFFIPFYWEGQFGNDHKLIRTYLKWGLDPLLREYFRSSEGVTVKSGNVGIVKFGTVEMDGYTRRKDIQLLEIAIIFIIAAAGLILAKRNIEAKRRRIMAKEAIILANALLIVMAILFPPCNKYTLSSKTLKVDKSGTGWAWILDTKEHGDFIWGAYKLSRQDAKYPEIRYDVLGLEIFGILVLAGTGLLITKKQ
jgi:cytochrome c oxidase subunit IV